METTHFKLIWIALKTCHKPYFIAATLNGHNFDCKYALLLLFQQSILCIQNRTIAIPNETADLNRKQSANVSYTVFF